MSTTTHSNHDHFGGSFGDFSHEIRGHFQLTTVDRHVFTTSVTPSALWNKYLNSFGDPIERQHHNCHCCRQFIERFGGLAVIDSAGNVVPAAWPEHVTPVEYRGAAAALRKAVAGAKITGVFYGKGAHWGTPEAGGWEHFYVEPAAVKRTHPDSTLTAGQGMAEKREAHKNLRNSLQEYKLDVIEQACHLLNTGQLVRAEKLVEWAKWLRDVASATNNGKANRNLLWQAVAYAPVGWCEVRSSMLGTLLDDIKAGKSLANIQRAYTEKMDPLAYQRPQADATAGAIAAAEKRIEQLGVAPSLERRYADYADFPPAVWVPERSRISENSSGGVFSHLKPKGTREVRDLGAEGAPQDITWDKFSRTVLPNALEIYARVIPARMNFCAFTTAVHADAPPILQWDSEDERNPFSWYVYHSGSPANRWGLVPGWVNVRTIFRVPSKGMNNHADGVLLGLEGCRETSPVDLCLFPETLKSELHSCRKVIEQFSKQGKLERTGDEIAGLLISEGRAGGVDVRVVTGPKTSAIYRIDRWD